MFKELSPEEERIGNAVVNAAYLVHKEFGPGLLEKVYEVYFCHVLTQKGFSIKRQMDIPIVFDNIRF
jgi:GxxExxY protein